jgi:transglutaminase-like putative cysteine protease
MTERRALLVTAEVALLGVTLSAVLGMERLFADGGWLGPLAVNAVAAHLTVAVARRRGLSLASTGVITVAAGTLVATWASYWSTTALGLPTATTWTTMQTDLSQAWHLYQDVIAPAPVEPGFVLASAVAIWFVAYVADWAAFRLWVPFEATLPAGTLFLFTALLGTSRGRGWAVALYAGALLSFLLLHRLARQDATSHWVAEGRVAGHRSLLVGGAAVGLVAVVVGTVVGPSVPGADAPGVLDPRALRNGADSRVTISPLVDIRSRLVNQSGVEVFRVSSSQPSYWRLTSLERFDGRIWSSSGSYAEADGDLPEAVSTDLATETFDQTFTIEALSAIWLPSAYEPRAFDGGGLDVLYEQDSATLIVNRDSTTSDGLVYRVTSASPRITAADLAGAGGEVPGDVRDRFLALPDDFSPTVAQLAQELTADAGTPYAAALALQNHLRTFTYDLTVNAGHSDDVLEQFLFTTQRGYCEQFAGAFAAMARSVGLPARVAVGFTSGEVDPSEPGVFRVRGEHAHAWPEVFLAGAGWVSFEPTPGRGMPFAESYTGVAPAQATSGDPTTATTSPVTTQPSSASTIPDASSDPRVRPDDLDTSGGSAGQGDKDDRSLPTRFVVRPLARVAPILAGVLLAYLCLVPALLALRRRRRRRRATTPADRIALAWSEAAEEAALVGYQEVASDTFDERARRLSGHLADPAADEHANALARRLEAATYAATAPDDLEADEAQATGQALQALARASVGRSARIARWFDPRPWLRAWRQARRGGHRQITLTGRGDLEAERELVGSGDRR